MSSVLPKAKAPPVPKAKASVLKITPVSKGTPKATTTIARPKSIAEGDEWEDNESGEDKGKGKGKGKGKWKGKWKGKGKSWDSWDSWDSKGKGKGKGKSWDSWGKGNSWDSQEDAAEGPPVFEAGDLLGPAVYEALSPVAYLELEWDLKKMSQRVYAYFFNAAKHFDWDSKPWWDLIDEYANSVFASMFQAVSDRPWVTEADFLGVMDAAIRQLFPERLFEGTPKAQFEKTVLAAHDRCFEECRFAPILWEQVRLMFVNTKERKQQNKLNECYAEGRKQAAENAIGGVDNFLNWWVHGTVEHLRQHGEGNAEMFLDKKSCAQLFHALLEHDGLPLPMTIEHGPAPDNWWLVNASVEDAYVGRAMRNVEGTSYKKKIAQSAKRAPDAASWLPWAAAGVVNPWAGPVDKKAKVAIPFAKPQGHAKCTQAEDCVGKTTSKLVQHIDDDDPLASGDLYCHECWRMFAMADPTLKSKPFFG